MVKASTYHLDFSYRKYLFKEQDLIFFFDFKNILVHIYKLANALIYIYLK